MGVIKRQSIKYSIIRYIGIGIGVFNLLLFYPLFLGEEKLGILNFVVNTAMLANTFVLFGANLVAVKYFPLSQKDKIFKEGFLSLLLLWVIIGFVIFMFIIFTLKSRILLFYGERSHVLPFIIPVVLLLALNTLLNKYISNFNRIVFPVLVDQFYKIVVPILAGLFFYQVIPFEKILYGVIFYYLICVIALIYYLKYLGNLFLNLDFSFLNPKLLKDIFVYAGFGILGSIGGVLATRIDSFMVASLIDFSSNGIYTIALFIAMIIRIPSEAVTAISIPIISKALEDNDIKEITTVYKKSSIILLTVGIFFFLGIWLNLDNLFEIMPRGESFSKGKYVVFILGIGILFDLITSVNGEIIALSKYFRYNLYFLIFLSILNISANIVFIPIYHINGAAIATTISLILFNFIKVIFIYMKFDIIPFSKKTPLVIFIGIMTYLVVLQIPLPNNVYLNLIIKSLAISMIYIPCIFYFKVSKDLNQLVYQIWDIISLRFGR